MGSIKKHIDPVLIVTAESSSYEALAKNLVKYQREYPSVAHAQSAADALLFIGRQVPCCCVIDDGLPNHKALELLLRIRKDYPEEVLPIVLLADDRAAELAIDALKQGAQECIVKSEMSSARLYGAITGAIRASEMQKKLTQLAHYDALTGLLNRSLLMNRLEQCLKRCDRYNERCALLYLDLDNFKPVNDAYGHQVGDLLLQAVADRIKRCCRGTDSPARLGGDEFVVLLESVHNNTGHKVADKIIKALSAPFELAGHSISICASIGLATYPDTARSAQELIKQADQALYRAKQVADNAFVSFSEKHRHQWNRQHILETALPKAIENGELSLVYQPIVSAKDFELKRIEVLSRWPREDYNVSAVELIEMIDRLSLNEPFHYWLFNTAFAQLKRWQNEAITPDICLNVPANYCYNTTITECIDDAILQQGINPQKVELEITESTIMRYPERSIKLLKNLNDRGIKIAIDDFGTGYSSMSYLTRLPLDTLKIDRNFFLTDINKDRNKKVIEAIAALGHGLGLEIIAEGVETDRELSLAKKVGCDLLQGYYFGKPAFAGESWKDYERHFEHLLIPKKAAAG